jgi:hypothetical protein
MFLAIARSQRSPFASRRFLVVVEFLGCLSGELEIRSQDDSVNRAGFLAEAAVDAFLLRCREHLF